MHKVSFELTRNPILFLSVLFLLPNQCSVPIPHDIWLDSLSSPSFAYVYISAESYAGMWVDSQKA